jgi:hypothetical protein
MKKIFTLFTAVLISFISYADVFTVSNNSDSPGEYTDIQSAIDAAGPYDTIYVHGSSTTYGNTTINKPLVLIGSGYHSADDMEMTNVDKFLIKKDGSLNPSGTYIAGFHFNNSTYGVELQGSVGVGIDDITVERCQLRKFKTNSTGSYDNFRFINCYIYNGDAYFWANNVTNSGFYNCIFENSKLESVSAVSNEGITIDHCLFLDRTGALKECFDDMSNVTIQNSIFMAANPTGGTDCIFNNNISYLCDDNTMPPTNNTGSGNFENTDPGFMDYDWNTHPDFSYDGDYHLEGGSVGENASTDGTNIGFFGGSYPYEVGLAPNIPYVIDVSLEYSTFGLYEPIAADFSASHTSTITGAEAFFNTDDGQGNGMSLSITSGDTVSWSGELDGSSLTTGSHYLYVRVKDESGQWSHWKREQFSKESLPLDIYAWGNSVSCFGSCDGSAEVHIYSGNGNYTYEWTDENYNVISTAETITGLCPGMYKLFVTDATAQIDSADVWIYDAEELVIEETIIHDSCGYGTGYISVEISAGAQTGGDNTITWSTSSTDDYIDSLSAGTYSITVEDWNACQFTETYTIEGPDSPFALNVTTVPSNCAEATGGATANASGGTQPYSYLWSDTETDASLVNHPSGTYAVTVTDNNGCILIDIAAISDEGAPEITVESITHVSCFGGNDGTIDISVTNGLPPYDYYWSNNEASEDVNGLYAGNYEIIVTDTAGCLGTANIVVTEPDEMILSYSITNATCGNQDGEATIYINGGTEPFSYAWETGGFAQTELNLLAGVYEITITDANDCLAYGAAAVSEDGAATITVESIVEGSCGDQNASIDISVSGGSEPYTYQWSDGSTNQDLTDVSPGEYSVTVLHDGNDCQAVESIEIPATLPATPSICIVTVDTTEEKNLIVWEKSGHVGIASYNIYRESSSAGDKELIGNVPYDHTSIFLDSTSFPMQQTHKYWLTAIDSCGNESDFSAHHKTLLLTINSGIAGEYNLIWADRYEGFSYTTYDIFRGDGNGLHFLISQPFGTLSYVDLNPLAGTNTYRVAAVKPGNPCDPEEGTNKIQSGPFSHSFSNLDDQTTETPECEEHPVNTSAISGTSAVNENDTETYAVDNTTNSTYDWTITGGTIVSGQGTNEISVQWGTAGNGSVQVTETNEYNCTGSPVSLNITISTGIVESDGSFLKVYPNPNSGTFYIEGNGEKYLGAKISLIDITGRIVMADDETVLSRSWKKSVHVDYLDSGIYQLIIETNSKSISRKIIVQ